MRGVRHPDKHKPPRHRRPGESRARPRAASVPRLPAAAEPGTLVPGLRGPCGSRGGRRVRSGRCGGAGAGRGAAQDLLPHRGQERGGSAARERRGAALCAGRARAARGRKQLCAPGGLGAAAAAGRSVDTRPSGRTALLFRWQSGIIPPSALRYLRLQKLRALRSGAGLRSARSADPSEQRLRGSLWHPMSFTHPEVERPTF